MDNKHNSDISADELLAQLKANMADGNTDEKSVTGKKYKFRRSGKITASVSEEDIKAHMPDNSDYSFESPVPKSDIEDLDIDELMKKYLPEEDYRRMTEKAESAEIEEEFVQTLSSIDIPEEMTEGSTAEPDIEDAKTLPRPMKIFITVSVRAERSATFPSLTESILTTVWRIPCRHRFVP